MNKNSLFSTELGSALPAISVSSFSVKSAVKSAVVASATALLTVGSLPMTASAAFVKGNDYESCVSELLDRGVVVGNATDACASALEPKDISACVNHISGDVAIAPEEALESCIRVRQPREMASCVVRVDGQLDAALPLAVLDYCTRSLLPEDYADCIVGINEATDIAAPDVLQTCIAADYRIPSEFYPNFIPATDPVEEPVEELIEEPTEGPFEEP